MKDYDAIIIGGGHNGLILGNYLAKAGLKTLILERRIEVGGGLSTEEITIPGFLHNLHSYFHDTINIMPSFVDLELDKFNARYHRPPVQAGIALRSGQAITMHTDLDKTYESIARLSKHDAEAYREMNENYREFMESIVVPALYTPPQPPSMQLSLLETSPEGLDFIRMGRLSPKEVLDEYFENEHVKALILHQLPIPRGILHDYDGLGTIIPLIVSQVEHSQICLGGSHVLAHALWRSYFSNGGMALGLSHVNKIIVENGEAKGVEALGGERYRANKLVASAVDLKQTFLEMVGEGNLEENFVNKVKNFKLDEFSIFGVHLALNEPLAHNCASFNPDIDQAFKLNIGLETPQDYHLLWSEIRAGKLPEHLGMFCSLPTLFDSTQAPKGKHTALLWQPVPYDLKEGGPEKWDEVKDEYMELCIDKWRQYAPNLTHENILMKQALSPLDIERKLVNMKAGGVFMGRTMLGQLEYFRPLPELSQFRTPIKNLYVCGACCHPGGGIIGAAGLIATEIIAEDYGLNKWWEYR
jgi:phytoene dehydrogenase-like protein